MAPTLLLKATYRVLLLLFSIQVLHFTLTGSLRHPILVHEHPSTLALSHSSHSPIPSVQGILMEPATFSISLISSLGSSIHPLFGPRAHSHFLFSQHNNTNPITNEPLTASDLITLNYSRKEATREIHDPIFFKPFSEHSHIVAIASTGNVFLAESVKGGRDLVADVPFEK